MCIYAIYIYSLLHALNYEAKVNSFVRQIHELQQSYTIYTTNILNNSNINNNVNNIDSNDKINNNYTYIFSNKLDLNDMELINKYVYTNLVHIFTRNLNFFECAHKYLYIYACHTHYVYIYMYLCTYYM